MALPDERDLIAALTADLEPDQNRAGFASDCAVASLAGGELVASIDAFADDTHFPEGLPARQAGRLAGRAALADLAAAGAQPQGVLVAYGVPADADLGRLERLASGLAGTVEEAGGEVLGGDTKPRGQLTVTIAALGRAPAGRAMTRENARPGDHLLVTGPLGGAGAALDRIREGLDPAEADPLIPPVRIDAGLRLREAEILCAMDLSDGLADAAVAISEVSDVGVRIDADAIPLHPWARENPDGLAHALSTGGDYELVAAVPEQRLERVHQALSSLGLEPIQVGRVREGEGAYLEEEGRRRELERGFEHAFEG